MLVIESTERRFEGVLKSVTLTLTLDSYAIRIGETGVSIEARQQPEHALMQRRDTLHCCRHYLRRIHHTEPPAVGVSSITQSITLETITLDLVCNALFEVAPPLKSHCHFVDGAVGSEVPEPLEGVCNPANHRVCVWWGGYRGRLEHQLRQGAGMNGMLASHRKGRQTGIRRGHRRTQMDVAYTAGL